MVVTVFVVVFGSWIVPVMTPPPPAKPMPPTAASWDWKVVKPLRALKKGARVSRTYRRSADTTGVTVSVTPVGTKPTLGVKATAAGPMMGVSD